MKHPRFIFINNNSGTTDIILHGGSVGIDSDFIQKVIKACTQHDDNVLAFSFPYMDRGDAKSSGPELAEEQEALDAFIKLAQEYDARNIHFIAKSLGGIVLSYYLRNHQIEIPYKTTLMGCVIGDVDLSAFAEDLTIIQGSEDKFGAKAEIEKALGEKKARIIEIQGADHSYRRPETKEPEFEDQAIKEIFAT